MLFENNQRHDFHLVNPSPWPILTAFSVLIMVFGAAMFFHNYSFGWLCSLLGLKCVIAMAFFWWNDILREAFFEGEHTITVQTGLKYGMLLFILSEVMFFFSFFWAFFHNSFNPSIFIGGIWPPMFFVTLNPWKLPLLNTMLLLTSGLSVTWAHHAIIYGIRKHVLFSLFITIFLALVFTLIQVVEYFSAPFSIFNTIYASCFFLATGFHGFHVVIGTLFLFVSLVRVYFNFFTKENHFGLEAAIWYWHFVVKYNCSFYINRIF